MKGKGRDEASNVGQYVREDRMEKHGKNRPCERWKMSWTK